MKSPRELLLHRHAAAQPKLDAARAEVVATLQPRPDATNWFSLARQELFWNSRRVWAGLAAVWAVLLVCNFAMQDRSVSTASASAAALPAAEVRQLWQAQARLRAELLGGMEPGDDEAVPPAPGALRPRSARRLEEVMV
ncbi:MAG: hypothetical protein HY300_09070 [Verrucomicrobia bacterium]|nr:hypothetical protein [Verrucomicrobiota bacterium]